MSPRSGVRAPYGALAGIAQLVERVTCNHKVESSILSAGFCLVVRVVKEADLKSVGRSPRRFKSCTRRFKY
jgi:hypothetical protein